MKKITTTVKNQKSSFEFKIESNIPVPIGHGNARYPFSQMKVGDSFYVSRRNHPARTAAISYGKRHNVKFITRVEGNGLRIWRSE